MPIGTLARLGKARSVDRSSLAASGFLNLHHAYELWSKAHWRRRDAIEASLLSGESHQELASSIGVTPACLSWYAAAFYNVRDRLDSPQFIQPLLADCRDVVEWTWKLIGYRGGYQALAKFLGIEKAGDFAQLESLLHEQTQLDLLARARFLAEGVVNTGAWSALWKSIQDYGEFKASSRLNAFEENVKAMMDSIPWCTKGEGIEGSPLAEFDACPAELRADEMLYVMQGGRIGDADEFRAKKLPVPRAEES